MGDTYPTVRVAAAQAAPVWLNREKTLEKAIALIEQAAAGGAKLVTFPEAWLPGYPWWIWLGTPAWGVPYFVELFSNGVEIPSATTQALCDAARKQDIYVVMGMDERAAGSLYCTQLFIDNHGNIIGRHRKLKPTHAERTIWGEGDGSDLFTLDTPFGKIGGLNCWEHLQPLTRYALYSLGEQIHAGAWPSFSLYTDFAPALGRVANAAVSRSYALEGQTFVIHTSATISQEMIDRLVDTDERRSLIHAGGGYTEIFGPDGSTGAGPLDSSQEGLLFADLDMSLIAVAKMTGDPTGHYSRPDVTQLWLNRQPRPAVQTCLPSGTLSTLAVPGLADPSIRQDKQPSGNGVIEPGIEVQSERN